MRNSKRTVYTFYIYILYYIDTEKLLSCPAVQKKTVQTSTEVARQVRRSSKTTGN